MESDSRGKLRPRRARAGVGIIWFGNGRLMPTRANRMIIMFGRSILCVFRRTKLAEARATKGDNKLDKEVVQKEKVTRTRAFCHPCAVPCCAIPPDQVSSPA